VAHSCPFCERVCNCDEHEEGALDCAHACEPNDLDLVNDDQAVLSTRHPQGACMQKDTVEKFKAEIAETRGLVASVKAFIAGLFERLRENQDDPDEVKAIIAEFDAAQEDLLAAMQENPETDPA
jgi:uncharacterized coiled-coil protein SlyX